MKTFLAWVGGLVLAGAVAAGLGALIWLDLERRQAELVAKNAEQETFVVDSTIWLDGSESDVLRVCYQQGPRFYQTKCRAGGGWIPQKGERCKFRYENVLWLPYIEPAEDVRP